MSVDLSLLGPDEDRRKILDFFRRSYSADLPDDFIPNPEEDEDYRSIIAQAVDTTSGRIVGAAMTHRTKQAVEGLYYHQVNARATDYAPVMDRHSELGMIAVDPKHRGNGIGGRLLSILETELMHAGVRLWFGHTEQSDRLAGLESFYRRHGFTVLPHGERVPPFFGRDWVTLVSPDTAWYFYKMLGQKQA